MKKHIYLLSALFLLGFYANAQLIQNPSFENWTTDTAYEMPASMQTLNLQSYFLQGSGNTTKSTDAKQGTYSARVESIQNGSNTLFGMISNGVYDGQTTTDGVPYTDKPDSAFFWVKYNVVTGDTAAVAFFFKKQGNVFGAGFQFFTGQLNTWTRIGVAINYGAPITPDSMIFMAVSSNPDASPIAGSFLLIDDIQFSGSAPSIPNGDFESWTPATIEQPDNWFALSFVNLFMNSPHVEKSTDAFDGNYSILLTTRIFDGDTFSFFSNSDIMSNDWDQGQSVSWDPMRLTGRYKYVPQGNDTAAVAVRTTRWDMAQSKKVILEEQLINLAPATAWTLFEVDFLYNSHLAPVDTLQLAFGSSNMINGQPYAADGSKLWIDSLNLTLYPLGIEGSNHVNNALKVFPNPAVNQISFQLDEILNSSVKNLIIFDVQSKKVMELRSTDLSSIDISQLESGVYFYIIESGQKVFKGKFSIR